jgi:hypothetical protein
LYVILQEQFPDHRFDFVKLHAKQLATSHKDVRGHVEGSAITTTYKGDTACYMQEITLPGILSKYAGCGRDNSHISKGNYKQMVRGITKNFLFPKCRYYKVFFYFRFSKLYRQNGGRDGLYTFGAVLLEWPPLAGPRTENDV